MLYSGQLSNAVQAVTPACNGLCWVQSFGIPRVPHQKQCALWHSPGGGRKKSGNLDHVLPASMPLLSLRQRPCWLVHVWHGQPHTAHQPSLCPPLLWNFPRNPNRAAAEREGGAGHPSQRDVCIASAARSRLVELCLHLHRCCGSLHSPLAIRVVAARHSALHSAVRVCRSRLSCAPWHWHPHTS